MKVTVYHRKFNEFGPVSSNGCEMFDVVAEIEAPLEDRDSALEYAWRWTNNCGGSWSRGEELEDGTNSDFNPEVTVLMENPKLSGGLEMGRRSSMVGDIFGIGEKSYKVAAFGFELQ